MRTSKVYEHPEFSADQVDFSLLSTINLILVLVVIAAMSIALMSGFVLWTDQKLCKLPLFCSFVVSLLTLH